MTTLHQEMAIAAASQQRQCIHCGGNMETVEKVEKRKSSRINKQGQVCCMTNSIIETQITSGKPLFAEGGINHQGKSGWYSNAAGQRFYLVKDHYGNWYQVK